MRVLRNACRHQNMQVVGTPAGNCEIFRCRFHGWTYDLQGRFLSAPPPVAPKDAQSPDLQSGLAAVGPIVGHRLLQPRRRARADRCRRRCRPMAARSSPRSPATGKSASNICWPSTGRHADFTWAWPLLVVRRAGAVAIIEQVVPHTFLRTRLFTHVFGAHRRRQQAGGRDHQACLRDACRPIAPAGSRQPRALLWMSFIANSPRLTPRIARRLNFLPRASPAAGFSLRMKSPHGSAQLFSMARGAVPANIDVTSSGVTS